VKGKEKLFYLSTTKKNHKYKEKMIRLKLISKLKLLGERFQTNRGHTTTTGHWRKMSSFPNEKHDYLSYQVTEKILSKAKDPSIA
jgi:hypothetical protein